MGPTSKCIIALSIPFQVSLGIYVGCFTELLDNYLQFMNYD